METQENLFPEKKQLQHTRCFNISFHYFLLTFELPCMKPFHLSSLSSLFFFLLQDPIKRIPDTHEITLQHGTKTVSFLFFFFFITPLSPFPTPDLFSPLSLLVCKACKCSKGGLCNAIRFWTRDCCRLSRLIVAFGRVLGTFGSDPAQRLSHTEAPQV